MVSRPVGLSIASSSYWVAALLLLAAPTFVFGQRVKVEMVPGVPFGVGRVVIPVGGIDDEKLETHFVSVKDAEGRVHYPAIRYTEPLGIVRELLNMPESGNRSEMHVHFLFTGSEPLRLELNVPDPMTITAYPNGRKLAYRRLLRSWWRLYKLAAKKQRTKGDYSPIVETYLTSMLSRRMGLNEDLLQLPDNGQSLSMLLGTEKIRLAMLQQSTLGITDRASSLTRSLPEGIAWPEFKFPPSFSDEKRKELDESVEPIAMQIPEECFYIRFAQFPNYLWLRRLLEEYGGDLSRMVLLRGTDSSLNAGVENQLGLRESALSSMLGPRVISDIAMIGRDTYLREGAAIGILFEAKNKLLRTELMNQRKKRVAELKDSGATIEDIKIGEHDASFASTSDNRLRSFYVQRDNYHLVTNCREIARRFLECRDNNTTLGETDEFRYARSLIPQGEENTLFVYLSRKFFEGLLSPQYQIELPRRLRSVTDAELMELATLAAAGEGFGNQPITIRRLVELGFLPAEVDQRHDGSETKIVDRQTLDTVRGKRGTFLPIPDTPIGKISEREWQSFERTKSFHQNRWGSLDPVLIGLRRTALDDDTERVEISARMLPINREKYGSYTEIFGPPTTTRIKAPVDDIVSAQAFVDGTSLGWGIPPHHLYFGVRDEAPKRSYSERRFLKTLQILRSAPVYLAAWPKPGFLESIGMTGRDMGNGYSRLLLGLYRLNAPTGFSLLSFDPRILENAAPMLGVEEADKPAQVHLKVGDIMNSNFGKWANDLDFQRAWETSVGNVRLLHVMTQQLHVPMPKAREAIERALGATLHCPLGGEYSLMDNSNGTKRWVSSSWADGKEKHRQEYVSPLMQWLRGFEASVTVNENRIVAEGVLKIKRAKAEEEGGIKLPLFDFLRGGKSKKKTPAENKDSSQQKAASE